MSKWEMVRLGDICEYEQPTKYIVNSDIYNDDYSVPVLTAGQTFILGYTDETENVFSNVPVIIFDDFTTAIKYVDFPFKVKSSAMKILNVNSRADIKFIYYLMTMIDINTELHKRYWISTYSNIEIKLPPLEEQKKIANELDKITSLIEKRKLQIEKLDVLVKAKFVEMFGDPVENPMGWEKDTLGNSLQILTDFSANGSYEYLDSNVKMYDEPKYALMVRTTDLEKRDFISDVKYVDENAYNILSKSKVFAGDIIMNKIGSAGKVYLMPKLDIPVTLGRNAFLMRLKGSVNNVFLYNLLTSTYGENEILKNVRGAVTKTITKDGARSVIIILPPIQLQNQFADYVQKVEQTKETLQKSLSQLETLYKQRMQEYFE